MPTPATRMRAIDRLPARRPHRRRADQGEPPDAAADQLRPALAAASFNGYATLYTGEVRTAFAGVGDAALQQELTAASAAAATAMTDLAAYMNGVPATATGFELGADRFLRMLSANEGVDTAASPSCSRSARRISPATRRPWPRPAPAMRPGTTIPACLGQLAANRPGDGPVAAATRQIAELRAFVVANDLVTIPGNEQIRGAEQPALSRRRHLHAAARRVRGRRLDLLHPGRLGHFGADAAVHDGA